MRKICVVVVADPDDADEVGGVSREPDVVAGSGFASGGRQETVRASSGTGAASHNVFKQRLGKIGHSRIEDLLGFRGEVGDDVAIRVPYRGEHPRGEVDTVISEDVLGASHIDRGSNVCTDGDRRGSSGTGDSSRAGESGYVAVSDHLRERDGGDVERVINGIDSGYHARVLALLEVAWSVGLAVGTKVLGVVVELGEGGEDSAVAKRHFVEAGVVGSGVDERFEDGAGGALSDGVVEL